MAVHQMSILDPMQDAPGRKAAGSLRLAPTMKNDVFLNALLEMPTTQQARRSPLKWLGAVGFHIVIVAALIIVPLYSTATIHLNEYHEVPLVAPPPPLAPPPGGGPVAPHITHPKAKLNYTLQKLTAPSVVPKTVSSAPDNVGETVPDRKPLLERFLRLIRSRTLPLRKFSLGAGTRDDPQREFSSMCRGELESLQSDL